MKRVAALLVAIGLVACKNGPEPHPDYMAISGKLVNVKSQELSVYTMGGPNKIIKIQPDGTFKDTLVVDERNDKMQLVLQQDSFMLALMGSNGADVELSGDAQNFEGTITFTGNHADYNNYLHQKAVLMGSEALGFTNKWYALDRDAYDAKANGLQKAMDDALDSYANIPPNKIAFEKDFTKKYLERLAKNYDEEHAYAIKLAPGNPSPIFEDYENFDGSTTSLTDFKGKYVYIDVWATWCAPCKVQIPYLKELEEKYKDENIVFLSLSGDKPEDRQKWLDMVAEKELTGVQVLAPEGNRSQFIRDYNINSIPRFIFIDPEGNIVDYDAPRPSDSEGITALFSVL